MQNVIRAKVSGSRKRYRHNGFDLDLTYITPRLIAMGYPASGMEKTYRNDINEVARFLNSHHPNVYRIYNLSERKYDITKFENRVRSCGFPDHHPPPLNLLIDIINDMLAWIAKSKHHVLVVHCLAGKGRTGVICSCFLLFMGTYGNVFTTSSDQERHFLANQAVQDFWQARGQGVRFPSQALYIYYFVCILQRLGTRPVHIPRMPCAKKLLLKKLVLHSIPDYDASPYGGCTPFLQVLSAPWEFETSIIWYNSAWKNPCFDTYASTIYGSIVFDINCIIQGDVVVRCFHANTSSMLGRPVVQMFHVSFYTNFIHQCDVYRISKEEVDDAHKSNRYDAAFCLDLHIESCEDDDEEDERKDLSRQNQLVSGRRRSTGSSMNSMSSGIITPMMGWLYKQGGFIRNWKRRWFVARDGQLSYFASISNPTPLGVVDLHHVQVDVGVRPGETTAFNPSLFYFKLIPPHKEQRVWYFAADTEMEQIQWIRELTFQACYHDLVSPRTPNRRQTTPMNRLGTVETCGLSDLVGFSRPPATDKPSSLFGDQDDFASQNADRTSWERHHFLKSIPVYTTAKPLSSTGPMSEHERQTIMNETFQVGLYICTAEELEEAGQLQHQMQNTMVGKLTLLESLTRAVEHNDYDTAEQILVEMVLLHYPKLVDALESNPKAFADMIARSTLPCRSKKEM